MPVALLLLLGGISAAHASSDSDVAIGRTLYLTGVRPDGSTLSARVQRDVELPAAGAACANCHRRSGLGTSEGTVRSLPVTGAALFNASSSNRTRPAYDDATLTRAVREGVAADGRALDPTMPRYALRDGDARALIAYLHELGSQAPPGVSDDSIELATIVADSAPLAERDAVLQVLERFVAIKNSGTRRETQRAAAARRHPLGEKRDRSFRRWNLSVWHLKGQPATWEAQLKRYYASRPPFAVLSGVADSGWDAVAQFCETAQVPCVLPVTNNPGSAPGFYSLYYSMGAALEGGITARHLLTALEHSDARILLVRSDSEVASAARAAFLASWAESGKAAPAERIVPSGTAGLTAREWQQLLASERPEILIAWLEPQQLMSAAISAELLPQRIYTAESVSAQKVVASTSFAARVWHVYPYRIPVSGRSQFPREQAWLKAQGLDNLPAEAAARALFACHALGEGLVAIENNFSRDYLLEQLEHMLDGTSMTSLFPATTLAPGQRVLSRGAYVMRPGGTAGLDARWVGP
jgi:hypothetical protein